MHKPTVPSRYGTATATFPGACMFFSPPNNLRLAYLADSLPLLNSAATLCGRGRASSRNEVISGAIPGCDVTSRNGWSVAPMNDIPANSGHTTNSGEVLEASV